MTNTALDAGIHTVRFTVYGVPISYLQVVLDDCFGQPQWHQRHGRYGYKRSLQSDGLVILYGEDTDHSSVEIQGAMAERIGTHRMVEILRDIHDAVRIKLTRVDLYIDAHDTGLTPAYMRQAHQEGRLRTYSRGAYSFTESNTGTTFALGSRTSDRYLRVYDSRGCTRVELELKGERAEAMRDRILTSDIPSLIVGAIRDYCDIITLDNKNRTRCTLDSIWHSVVGDYEKVRVAMSAIPQHLQRSMDWVRKQVAPTLAAILYSTQNLDALNDRMAAIIQSAMLTLNTVRTQRKIARFAGQPLIL